MKTKTTVNPIEKFIAEIERDVIAFRVDLPHKTRGYCRECFKQSAIIKQYKNILFTDPKEQQKGVTSLTNQDDENLFGHICTSCKSPLADWSECRFCHAVFWDDIGHTCGEMPRNLYQDWTVQRFYTDAVEWPEIPPKKSL